MSNNEVVEEKRYWMKMYSRFFDKHEIKILLGKDRDYVLFYIAMLLESIAHQGNVRFNEEIPYTNEDLAILLNMPEEKVEKCISVLSKFRMLEVLEDGTIFLPAAPAMCGCTTTSTERVHKFRNKSKKNNISDGEEDCHEQLEHAETIMKRDETLVKRSETPVKRNETLVKRNETGNIEYRVNSIESRDNIQENIEEEVSYYNTACACVREGDETSSSSSDFVDVGLKYPKTRLKKLVNPVLFSDVLAKDEVEPFIDYVIDRGFCEKEANQTVTATYLKILARSWKAEGHADKVRHKITRKELNDVVRKMNETREEKITDEYVSEFWDFLAPDFVHKNGEMVTKYTVATTLKSWYDIKREPERQKRRQEREEEAAKEKARIEEQEREDRLQRLLLSEDGD